MSKKFLRRIAGVLTIFSFIFIGEINSQNSSDNLVHTVQKGETVYGISKQYNVPLETLYRLNPDAKKGVKKGDKLQIPTYTQISEKSLEPENIKEKKTNNKKDKNSDRKKDNTPKENKKDTPENTVKNESSTDFTLTEQKHIVLTDRNEPQVTFEENIPTEESDSIGLSENEEFWIKIALLLDDPNSKRDIDFTRGFLTRLDEFSQADYKINLKVVDGRSSTGDILNILENYEPNVIITTADKTFPLFLVDYGNTNNVEVVNVFDLKNDLYEDNQSMVQMLPPSSFFNNKIAERIYKENRQRRLIMVGEEDENDGIASDLTNLFGDEVEILSLEEFGNFEPDVLQPLLLYSFATNKEEVADFLTNVENLTATYPGADFRTVGRASWIAMIDDFGDKFRDYSVYVPSRVWIDEEGKDWKKFYSSYENLYGGFPIRSIPNYAASGYDIANYFIPVIIDTEGDFERFANFPLSMGLQNGVKLKKIEDGGYINEVGFIIHFRPSGEFDKIVVD